MYGGNLGGIFTAMMVIAGVVGVAIGLLIWAFVVWLWPVLKLWIHHATA